MKLFCLGWCHLHDRNWRGQGGQMGSLQRKRCSGKKSRVWVARAGSESGGRPLLALGKAGKNQEIW